MFFKKNKPAPSSEAEHQVAPKKSGLSGQSLFAPELNATPAPIDFGFNNFAHPQTSTHAVEPWQPEPWKAPAAPEPENWAPPENPASPASGVSSFEPVANWEESLKQSPQAPLPFSASLEPSRQQPVEQPASEWTPEQAWSILEPTSALMPAEPESLSAPVSELWAYPSPAAPMLPGAAQQESIQQDWEAAFIESPSSGSVASDAFAQFTPPMMEPDIKSASSTVEIEQGWAYPTNLGLDMSTEHPPVEPAAQSSFDSYISPVWTTPSPPLSEVDLPPPTSPLSEMELAWSDESSPHTSFDSPLPNLSVYPVEDSFSPEPTAPVSFEAIVPPLDTLWSGTSLETEEAFSVQSPPQAFMPEQEQAPVAAPAYVELPELPSFTVAGPISPQGMPEFDPIKASQELAAGWAQMEKTAPAITGGLEEVQALPLEPQVSTWADENMPAPMSQQALSAEWANFSSAEQQTEPVYLHEMPSTAQSEADLWNNLSMPGTAAPGEQVPLVSGALMEGINQQLYPEDPFSSVNDEFAAGEQAFAEAAQFLFPETMSAPLEWGDQGYGLSNLDDADEEGVSVMDLGPSYLPQAQGFSQLSNELPTGFPHVADLKAEAFSGVASREEEIIGPASMTTSDEDGYSISEEEVFGPSPYATDESLDELSAPSAETPSSPENPSIASYPTGEVAALPQAEWGYAPPDARSNASEVEVPTPRLEQSWYTEDVLGALATPGDAPDMLAPSWMPQPLDTLREAELANETIWEAPPRSEEWVASQQPLAPTGNEFAHPVSHTLLESMASDEDFYATAYTLNEQGELVPVDDDDLFIQLESLAPPRATSQRITPSSVPSIMNVAPTRSEAFTPEIVKEVAAPSWAPPAIDRSFPQETVPEWTTQVPISSESFLTQPAYGEELPEDRAWPRGHDAGTWLPPAVESVQASMLPPAADILPAATAVSLSAFELGLLTPPPYEVEPAAHAAPDPTLAWPELAPPPIFVQETSPQPIDQRQSQPQAQWQPLAQPVAPLEKTLPPEKQVIRPKPLTRKLPSPAQAADLSAQWYDPNAESAQPSGVPYQQPPSQATTAMKLTLGNMEVMGLCPLSPDKRLIVVHNAGVYALMAQNGQEQPDISVLKVFEHNPLAYQHTFTAVEEGQAAGQGMYVVQVGTWHAIISTFQDKITLHTELG